MQNRDVHVNDMSLANKGQIQSAYIVLVAYNNYSSYSLQLLFISNINDFNLQF